VSLADSGGGWPLQFARVPRFESMTVVFTDVVGSTAWRFRVGGRTADERTIDFERASRGVVGDHGGIVVKGVGDGVMATFAGAVSAIDAAVSLQIVARRLGIGVGLRVGISSGDLLREGNDWVGDAAIEASRLCGEAGGGVILCSDVAVRLAGSRLPYEVRSVGPRTLRGFEHPVGVYELVVDSDRAAPPEIVQATQLPFIGRHTEVGELVALLRGPADGASCAAVIRGEAGIGKTCLAAQVALHAQELGFRVLYARCAEGQATPYGALLSAFESWLAGCPHPLLARVAQSPNLAALLEHVPEVVTRLDLPTGDNPTDAHVRRARLLTGFCELVTTVATERPVLLVVDDLHWAEASTALALEHIVQQGVAGLAVLATTRGLGVDAGTLTPLASGAAHRVVQLEGLSDRSVAQFIAARIGRVPPDHVARALRAVTDGNPFFLDAWLSDPASAEQLQHDDGSWCSQTELADLQVPEGARGVVRRRIGKLDETARRTLQVGAVMGSTFDALAGARAMGLDLSEWIETAERGVAIGLVREIDVGRFEFKHAIVRQTLLDDMSRTLQATLHWRVGEAIELASPSGRRSEIAMHYAAGLDVGEPSTVARAAWAAGDEAIRAAALEEAAAHYRTVLAALDRLPADPDQRYRALVALGRAQNAVGDIVGAGPVWLQAAATARALADPERLFEAAHGYNGLHVGHDDDFVELLDAVLQLLGPGDSPLKAIAMGWRAVPTAFVQARRQAGIDHDMVAHAVDMAERSGDPKAIAATLRSRSVAESHSPDAEGMRRDLLRVTALGREHDLKINDEPSILFVELAVAELRLGHRKAAQSALDEAQDLAARNRSSRGQRQVAVLAAAMSAAAGRFDEANEMARRARGDVGGNVTGQLTYSAQILAIRLEQGRLANVIAALREFERLQLPMRAWSMMLTGALADAGEHDEARTRLGITIRELALGQRGFADQLLLRHVAETARRLNDAAAAEAMLTSLDQWADQLLVVPYGTSVEGAADRARGQLLATLQRFDEADTAFQAAETLERSCGFPALATRTAYWRAVTLLARRTPAAAEAGTALLRDVADEASRLGMLRLAEQATTARDLTHN
jgi:class 3 adenylate cyclase/tetratricopeptide (TPR) repeat protein